MDISNFIDHGPPRPHRQNSYEQKLRKPSCLIDLHLPAPRPPPRPSGAHPSRRPSQEGTMPQRPPRVYDAFHPRPPSPRPQRDTHPRGSQTHRPVQRIDQMQRIIIDKYVQRHDPRARTFREAPHPHPPPENNPSHVWNPGAQPNPNNAIRQPHHSLLRNKTLGVSLPPLGGVPPRQGGPGCSWGITQHLAPLSLKSNPGLSQRVDLLRVLNEEGSQVLPNSAGPQGFNKKAVLPPPGQLLALT